MVSKSSHIERRQVCPLCYVQSIEGEKVGCGDEMFLQGWQKMSIGFCRKVWDGMKEVCHGGIEDGITESRNHAFLLDS